MAPITVAHEKVNESNGEYDDGEDGCGVDFVGFDDDDCYGHYPG